MVSSSSSGHAADIRNRASEVGENVREMAGSAREMARDTLNRVKETASDAYEQGKQRASEWQDDLESTIRARPLTAILIAAGVGVALGFLWRRS
jgi:ElaB/YqjD/DUF883 family membrane-anchored ribosome-binding protein